MKIKLSDGLFALVDDSDASKIEGWKVYPVKKRNVIYGELCRWDSKAGKQLHKSLHRVIMDAPKGSMICHLNGNGLDCRRSNLSFGSHQNNGSSHRSKRKGAASAYRGVHLNKGGGKKWSVMFYDKGKVVYLGRYDDEKEAALIYDNEAKKRFGKFAHLNFK